MGDLCRVPAERAVLGKEVVAERQPTPRDLRVSRGDLGGGPGSRFRGPAPKDDPCFLLGDALRDGRRDGVRGAQERGRLSAWLTLVLARWARRRAQRCSSIVSQRCARRQRFSTGVRAI